MDNAQDFHGVWKLLDWSVSLGEGGESRRPFGGEVDGFLVYHPEGWVCASLMERGRGEITQDRQMISALRREVRADLNVELQGDQRAQTHAWFLAANGYITYTGPFDVDEKEVHHRVQVSLIPQWVGTTLSRRYTFLEGGAQLQLVADQGDVTDSLLWQRVSRS